MRRKITLELDDDVFDTLTELSGSLGFTREAAAEYAIRLVGACVREGLIEDVPASAWPREAQLLTGTGGKVLPFPAGKRRIKKNHRA